MSKHEDAVIAKVEGRRSAFAETIEAMDRMKITNSDLRDWIDREHMRAQLELVKAGGK